MPTGPDLRSSGHAPEVDQGVSTLVHRAIDDARELARAEIALVKAKAGERATAFKNATIFFGAAAVLALAAIITLLVGLVITLTPLVGPGGATAIVVVGTLVIAGVLGMIGKGKLAPPKGLS